ncbi:MAG: AtpZ/AtpI family protein [Bacteroidales bacterium]|nr:AtpZ/AtpI family protein [Bacteroidales bacterium]
MNSWLKYSTLGLEMAVIVAAFVVGGVALDKRVSMQFPLFTLLGVVMGLTIALIRLVRVGKEK